MSNQNDQAASQAPAGFHRLGSVSSAGWVKAEEGNTVHGILQGIYSRPDTNSKAKDGRSNFFQVKLLSPCKVNMGTGEGREEVEAEIGDIVNVNEGPKTLVLKPLCDEILQGAEHEVYMFCNGKVSLKGGKKTMWDWDVQSKCNRPKKASEPDLSGSGEQLTF